MNVNKIHKKQLVYIFKYFAKTFSYKGVHKAADPCVIKGKTKQATVIQLELSQSCVKTTR